MNDEILERILSAIEKLENTMSMQQQAGQLRALRADAQQMRISNLYTKAESLTVQVHEIVKPGGMYDIQQMLIDELRAQNAVQAEQLDRLADAVPSAGAHA